MIINAWTLAPLEVVTNMPLPGSLARRIFTPTHYHVIFVMRFQQRGSFATLLQRGCPIVFQQSSITSKEIDLYGHLTYISLRMPQISRVLYRAVPRSWIPPVRPRLFLILYLADWTRLARHSLKLSQPRFLFRPDNVPNPRTDLAQFALDFPL